MKRSASALLLVVLICVNLLSPSAVLSSGEENLMLISASEPYITSVVGQTVDLSVFSVMADSGIITPDEISWTSNGENISSFTPTEAGVYPIHATTAEGTEMEILIISKYEGESEYVIYRNDFDAPASLDGLIFESGKDLCRWENGALVMDSTVFGRNTVSILLPEMLSAFGSYRVEAVFSIEGIAAANSSFSLLFRAGDMNSPRCRLSVINKASYDDGISFETYSLSSGWTRIFSAGTGYDLSSGRLHTLSLEVKENAAKGFLDGEPYVFYDAFSPSSTGAPGIMAEYAFIRLDSIKVTLQETVPEEESPAELVKTDNTSPIASGLGIYSVFSSGDIRNCIESAQGVVVSVGPGLMIYDTQYDVPLFHVSRLFDLLGDSAFPVFVPYNGCDVSAELAEYLKTENRADTAYMDSDPVRILNAKSIYPLIRGIFYGTAEDESKLIESAILSRAQTVALDSDIISKEIVFGLQKYGFSVASFAGENNEELITSVLSGSNIVIVGDSEKAFETISLLGDISAHVPQIIGYRGLPEEAPENSVSSFLLAAENGASAVYADIRLTSDGHTIVFRGTDAASVTTGSGNIDGLTLDEIKSFHLWGENNRFEHLYPDERVATLSEFLDAFENLDTIIYLDPALRDIDLYADMIDLVADRGMSDRVIYVCDDTLEATAFRDISPSARCALSLSAPGSVGQSGSIETELAENLFPAVTSYAPVFIGSGLIPSQYSFAANVRGLCLFARSYSVSPSDNSAEISQSVKNGLSGICVQRSSEFDEIFTGISTDGYIPVDGDGPFRIKLYGQTVSGDVFEMSDYSECGFHFVSGEENCTVSGGCITPVSVGRSIVVVTLTSKLPDGTEYSLASLPTTIDIASVPEEKLMLKPSSPYRIDRENNIIIGVSAKTDIDKFMDEFLSDSFELLDNDMSVYSGKYVVTGSVVAFYRGGQTEELFWVSVLGDINGDGVITATDCLLLKRNTVVSDTLRGAFRYAGDIDGNGKISAIDNLMLKRMLLGI